MVLRCFPVTIGWSAKTETEQGTTEGQQPVAEATEVDGQQQKDPGETAQDQVVLTEEQAQAKVDEINERIKKTATDPTLTSEQRNAVMDELDSAKRELEAIQREGKLAKANAVLADPNSTKEQRTKAYSDLISYWQMKAKQHLRESQEKFDNGDELGALEADRLEAEARVKKAEAEIAFNESLGGITSEARAKIQKVIDKYNCGS